MPEQWYYAEGESQRGPVGPDAIKALIRQGRINADTLIWCEGEPAWKPARDFALYFPVTSPSAPIPAPAHRFPPPQPKPPQRATLVIAPQPKRRRLWLWIGGPIAGLLAVAVIVPQLLRSRLAANESAALMACLTYVTAQDICHLQDRDGDGTCEYATNLADLEQLGVIDMAMANAGGEPGQAIAGKAGYCFKVLMQQGDSGPEGPHDYRDDKGNMLLGHALVAYPVEWDSTGRHTFMVNHWGNVFRKDLGAETSRHVATMKAFAVDETWELVGSSYSDDMEAYRVRGMAKATNQFL